MAALTGADRAALAPLLEPLADDPLLTAFGAGAEPGLAGASNVWAVDGTRSSSGKPLLANDPHLWLSAPSLWYLADVEGAGFAAIGGTLPGVPAVLVGRNRQLGWGLTTANIDDQDIFIEEVDPADPGRYRLPDGGWAEFEERPIRIEIDGGRARDRHGARDAARAGADGRPVRRGHGDAARPCRGAGLDGAGRGRPDDDGAARADARGQRIEEGIAADREGRGARRRTSRSPMPRAWPWSSPARIPQRSPRKPQPGPRALGGHARRQ